MFKHYDFVLKEKCNRFLHDVVTSDVGAWRFDKRLHFPFESVIYHDDQTRPILLWALLQRGQVDSEL